MPNVASPQDDPRISRSFVAAVVVLTIAIRVGFLLLLPTGLNVDTDGYRLIAVTLRATGTFGVPTRSESADVNGTSFDHVRPTAFRPPLYPILLSLFVADGRLSPWAIGGLHVALGCGTVALVYWLAATWGLARWSLLAAILAACDPILLYQSAQIMTETTAAFLSVAALACLTWLTKHSTLHQDLSSAISTQPPILLSLLTGAVLGLACLSRPTFLPWSGLIVASFLLENRKPLGRWPRTAGLVCGILIALVPWGLRNYLQFGHFKVTTTHGGLTVLLGNNESFYRYLRESPAGEVWHSEKLERDWAARDSPPRGEFESDQLAYRWAQESIRAEPRMFMWACLVRISRFWRVLPHRVTESEPTLRHLLRVTTALWYVVVYGLMFIAIAHRRKKLLGIPWRWGVLLCLAFTAVHSVYWSDMRMRAPVMPFVCVLAAAGAADFAKRLARD